MLEHFGYEPDRVNSERVTPLLDDHGWEAALARAYVLADMLESLKEAVSSAAWRVRLRRRGHGE